MARKNVLLPFAMFGASGADMSQPVSVSTATDVTYQDNIGILASWSGTSPVGQLFIEVFDPLQGLWTALDFGAQILVSGNSGSHEITINQLPFAKLRARYAGTSGTGALFATLTAKQVGG